MATYDYDLLVIGAGSGGVRAARMASQKGARVAVCEAHRLGGTCVNVGCVPKKLLVYGADFGDELEDAPAYGWSVPGEPRFDWSTLIAAKDREIARLNGIYEKLLTSAGVTILEGRARCTDAHTVEVNGTRYTAEHILVATGSEPAMPGIPGHELVGTSDDAFHLAELPKHVTVVGGGYIGVEFACIFRGFGAEVTHVHRGDPPLRGFDDEMRQHLREEMRKLGIDLQYGRTVERVEEGAARREEPAGGRERSRGEDVRLTLDDGRTLETGFMLCATGRTPRTDGMGLDEVGVERTERGAIRVDEFFRSSVPSIRGLGDVIDRVPLTPVALEEGMALADMLFADRTEPFGYGGTPSAVFSRPPLATVGLTEGEAVAQYDEVDVYRTRFTPMKHALTGRDQKALMKILVDRRSDVVLGLHMVGPEAAEIVQGFAAAMVAGATKTQLDRTVGIHPTSAEEFVTMRQGEPAG